MTDSSAPDLATFREVLRLSVRVLQEVLDAAELGPKELTQAALASAVVHDECWLLLGLDRDTSPSAPTKLQ